MSFPGVHKSLATRNLINMWKRWHDVGYFIIKQTYVNNLSILSQDGRYLKFPHKHTMLTGPMNIIHQGRCLFWWKENMTITWKRKVMSILQWPKQVVIKKLRSQPSNVMGRILDKQQPHNTPPNTISISGMYKCKNCIVKMHKNSNL